MNAIKSNHCMVFAEHQPEYNPLPALRKNDSEGTVLFRWQLTWRERLQLLFNGVLYHQVQTFYEALQPQLLSTQSPEIWQKELEDERCTTGAVSL